MFFFLTKNKPFNHAILSDTIYKNDWIVQLDQGWSEANNTLYKGYSLGKPLEQKIDDLDFSECPGNYCIINFNNNNVSIHTDDSRAFPIAMQDNDVFNLCRLSYDKSYSIFEDAESIWVDGSIQYQNGTWLFNHHPEKNFTYSDTHPELSFDDAVDMLCDHLVQQASSLDVDGPLLCGNSSGFDSTLVRSAFDYLGIGYEMVYKNQKE